MATNSASSFLFAASLKAVARSCGWRDLNPRHSVPKTDALSAELQPRRRIEERTTRRSIVVLMRLVEVSRRYALAEEVVVSIGQSFSHRMSIRILGSCTT